MAGAWSERARAACAGRGRDALWLLTDSPWVWTVPTPPTPAPSLTVVKPFTKRSGLAKNKHLGVSRIDRLGHLATRSIRIATLPPDTRYQR
jgi:hypothetical protein